MKQLTNNKIHLNFKRFQYLLISVILLFISLLVFGLGLSWSLQNVGLSPFYAGTIASQASILLYGLALLEFNKDIIKKSLSSKLSLGSLKSALIITLFVLIVNIVISYIIPSDSSSMPESTQNLLDSKSLFTVFFVPVIIAPIFEELTFRAGLKYFLVDKGKLNPITYIIFSSLIFGLLHWSGDDTAFTHMTLTAIMGVIYSVAYLKTKNIFIPMLSHFIYNGLIILLALLK